MNRFARICTLSALTAVAALSAQEKPRVSEEEVRAQRVDFINRSNARADVTRMKQDTENGRTIAKEVVEKKSGGKADVNVLRVYDPAKTAGFGADVVSIAPTAKIDHINMIQRVLIGYLMQAFEYNEKDAEVVSRFVLYYNARQRADVERVKQKYSDDVVAVLDPAKIGIDRRYNNWAGKTQILLPLKKNIVRPDKTDINDGEIKKDSGKVTEPEKKQLDDVQKRRQEEDKKKLDDKEKKTKEEEKKVTEEKKQVEKQKEEIKKEQADTNKKLEDLKKDPEKNKEEIKKTEEKKTELTKKEEEVKKKEEVVAKKEEEVKKTTTEIEKQKEDNKKNADNSKPTDKKDEKISDLQKENEQLKKEQKQKDETSANVAGEKIFFLRILRYMQGGHYSNEMWMIDAAKDDTLFRGPYTNICGRELVVLPEGILVIGYDGAHEDSGHSLVLLDKDTLLVKKTSKEQVFWRTPMMYKDGKVFAFEKKEGNYFLARFAGDLNREAQSSEPIAPDSDITFFKEKIYVTGTATSGNNTTIRIFNRSDLKHLKTITPPAQAAATGGSTK